MANTLLTAGQISRTAIGLLTRSLVLPMTVTRIPETEFGGQAGDTVTVRVRAKVAARTQANPGDAITYDDLTEVAVPVSLAHIYNATKIPDEALTLSIADFGAQVIEPQAAGIAEGAENNLAAVMNALATDGVVTDAASAKAKLLEARETLTRASVPLGERFLAASPEFITFLLEQADFTRVDAVGTPTAINNATFGRIYGFTVVESAALDAGEAVAYHRTSFAMAVKAPTVPEGAAAGASSAYGGVAMRWLRHYDPDTLQDRSVLSTFVGSAGVDAANRAFKFAAV